MRSFLVSLLAALIISPSLHAGRPDEGMWLPIFLTGYPESQMQKLGFELTAEDIYNVNNSSIKDAVVSMGRGFCTGELVSEKGLLFTNHHCGYDAIAELSTVENDYLNDGFWSQSLGDEIPVEGLFVRRLVRMEDVSEIVNQAMEANEQHGAQMRAKRQVADSLKQAATEGRAFYEAELKTMYSGTEHYLQVYEVFKDVRLVGTPPSNIGKFGGDTDNWMWPRHTGDFSIFRVYANADNEPAEYDPENQPYQPRHHLPISLSKRHKGDFAMIMGYPGTTERYLTSHDVSYKLNVRQPALISILDKMLKEMNEAMDADKELALEMASREASLANYEKYLRGQRKGLREYGLVEEQQAEEARFQKWASRKPSREQAYGGLFEQFEKAYQKLRQVQPGLLYTGFAVLRNDAVQYASKFTSLANTLSEDKNADVSSQLESLRKATDKFYENRHKSLNKDLLSSMLVDFHQNVPEAQQPALFSVMTNYTDKVLFFNRDKGETEEERIRDYVDMLWEESILLEEEEVRAFLDKPTAKIQDDPMLEFAQQMSQHYRSQQPLASQTNIELKALRKSYIKGLREWKEDKHFYPNANSTLRLTYGTVTGYTPKDGMEYDYITTHYGILAKEDPNDPEFRAPEKLLTALENNDFGRYGKSEDTLVVNFLTDNDITGGNSGSPVLDERGRLIGLAFDGNWESMTGDILVNPKLNRTICVDIRYVLFIIDKIYGAERLIEELDIQQPTEPASREDEMEQDKPVSEEQG